MSLIRCVSFSRGTLWSVNTARRLQVSGHARSRRLSTISQSVPPILSILPARALVDEKFKVQVENLPPGSPVTLHSLHHSEDRDVWEAYGHYVSDHRGTVSVAEDLSFGGTYTGKEPMGLLWSLRPAPGSRKGIRLRKMDVCSPMLVNISVYSGHVAEGFGEQAPLASAPTERWYMAPGVQRIDIRQEGVQGTLFMPPGPGPFPGLLDLWGGGGGLLEYRSALLASHGFASLALEYLLPGELKSSDLELNFFETAFNIVKDHPQVMPDNVGIFGLSLGSVMTFLLVSESNIIKPRCCVCVSASHSHPREETLYTVFARHFDKIRFDENKYHIWRSMGLEVMQDPSKKVDVGKINCPVMLLNGLDDQNWPTVECAKEMAQTLQAAGKEHLLTAIQYPDTGHLIEPPYSPHFRATTFVLDNSKGKAILLWGGQTKPHSDAQEDSWRKILTFLQQHLYASYSPKAKM